MSQDNKNETETPSRERVGVYICRCGGNISDVVDVARAAEQCRRLPGVHCVRVHTFMCSDPGQRAIQEDILQERLDRVVVASCTPALHELTFRGAVARAGMNPYLYEHANIREQCSWAHRHDPAGATAKAVRMIGAAVGKALVDRPLDQIHLPNRRVALVVGGGIAGMKAAADLAECGIKVVLVEQAGRLGGNLNQLGKVFPTETAAASIVAELERRLAGNPKVEVLPGARVTGVKGFIGNFQVRIEGAFGPAGRHDALDQTVGVIVMATGFRAYAPRQGEYAFGDSPAVVTMPRFIELLEGADGRSPVLMHEGRPVRSVAFIHCVGSRQFDGVHEPQPDGQLNPYCSRVCCTTTLQQALRLRRRFPATRVYDLHQDIRTYGRGHEDYYVEACKAGVTFLRWSGEEPPRVEPEAAPGRRAPALGITVKDELTWGEELRLGVDMVVLAVGMMPSDKDTALAAMLKLPVGEDRFLQEIHPKLRPVEVSVSGVLLAGTAQGPMNIQESLAAASAAAAKAAAMLGRDEVELNPFVAAVDEALCAGCGLCVGECEYDGALALTETAGGVRARVNPGLCTGCGACVPLCPRRAIDLNGWRIDQFEAMVDALAAELPATGGAAS